MAATPFVALVLFILFNNFYPSLDDSNSSQETLTYTENTSSFFPEPTRLSFAL